MTCVMRAGVMSGSIATMAITRHSMMPMPKRLRYRREAPLDSLFARTV
jgi:hypothetical protein